MDISIVIKITLKTMVGDDFSRFFEIILQKKMVHYKIMDSSMADSNYSVYFMLLFALSKKKSHPLILLSKNKINLSLSFYFNLNQN